MASLKMAKKRREPRPRPTLILFLITFALAKISLCVSIISLAIWRISLAEWQISLQGDFGVPEALVGGPRSAL